MGLDTAKWLGVNDHRFDRAVAPNLFDVVLDPELAFTLILANLMSPRLWELRERVLESPESPVPHIHELLDHHFEHVSAARIAEMNGFFDLDVLEARDGKDAVEYARDTILKTIQWRVKRGTMKKDDFALELFGQRKFPAYTYGTIDEAWACRRLLQGRKHKPLGLTCCLDEATIFAALALMLEERAVDNLVLLGAPTHYSAFTSRADGLWWFYSKHELFSPATWSSLVAEHYGGDGQLAFDDRLPDFDRIITAFGNYELITGESSMPERRLAEMVTQSDEFFGFRPAQLRGALQRPTQPVAGLDIAQIVADAASASGAEGARTRVRQGALEEGNIAALRALYTYRTLDVPDLSVYLEAGRYSSQIGSLLPHIQTADDAMRSVAAIAGDESIFEDPNRIAMPDETVRFATGTSRDKALLLHVLLERALAADDPARSSLEALFTETDSYVRSAGFCISVSRMAYVPKAEGDILYRIADAVPDGDAGA